jgi:hypothetical protein
LPESEKHLVYEVGKQIGLDLKSVDLHPATQQPNNPVIGTVLWTKQRKSSCILL